MNYYERIQTSLDYIEENLNEEIKLEVLAQISYLSKYHFHRVFTVLVGEPVMTYIRKRRLGRATLQLDNSDLSILEIALDNCFESQEVFSRAFLKHFGITPGKYRKLKEKINLTEKISLIAISHEKENIHPKIVISPEKRLVGMYLRTTWEENLKDLTIAKFHEDIFDKKIENLSDIKNKEVKYGICETDYETGEILHFAGVEMIETASVPNDMFEVKLPYSRYVVFYHKGAIEDIAMSYDYIYRKWLPLSGYELAKHGKDMQVYYKKFTSDDKCYEMQIHVPIE